MSESSKKTPRLCPLPEAGFIGVGGADAERFLHDQLSRIITNLDDDEAPLAAWHDAKGRVRAIFRVLALNDQWLLITPQDRAPSAIEQLARYVLRSDVTLEDQRDRWRGAALVADSRATLESWLEQQAVALDYRHDAAAHAHGLHWVRIGPALAHLFGRPDAVAALAGRLPGGPAIMAELAEIRLGVPQVTNELDGRFIPQHLNLDVLGAVVLDKGCYPGQEIIARTQNLGAVKRRTLRFSAAPGHVIPALLTPIRDAQGNKQGEIVRVAGQAGAVELLAVVAVEAAEAALFVEGAGETALEHRPLAYESKIRG